MFLLRDPRNRTATDPVARSRSLSPGPSILKEMSAFKSKASDAQLKQDEDGNVQKVDIMPLWQKEMKQPPRGRKKAALPIPQAKVSRNVNARVKSPESPDFGTQRDVSPRTLSMRHASPREDTFEENAHSIVVHPPSPPESDVDDDEDVLEDSDEEDSPDTDSPSRSGSVDDDIETIDNRFSKCNIDAHPHAVRHEKRDSIDSRKDSESSRRSSQASRKDSEGSRKDSASSRKDSTSSRKDSDRGRQNSDDPQRPNPARRSSSADAANEKWLRRSSIYGVRSRAPRVPTRLGTMGTMRV